MIVDLIIYIQQNMNEKQQLMLFSIIIFLCIGLGIIDKFIDNKKEKKKKLK